MQLAMKAGLTYSSSDFFQFHSNMFGLLLLGSADSCRLENLMSGLCILCAIMGAVRVNIDI